MAGQPAACLLFATSMSDGGEGGGGRDGGQRERILVPDFHMRIADIREEMEREECAEERRGARGGKGGM